MSLTSVWVQTQSDGLVRADQIAGIDAHQTPAVSGKPSRWLDTIRATYGVTETEPTCTSVRRTALGHAVISYLFGTGILAVAVNLVTNIAG